MTDYKKIATDARKTVLAMIYKAQSSHIGSNFSVIDILAVLFEKMDVKKDKFIASKGWVAASVYYFLAEKGVIPKEDLERYCGPNEEIYIGLVEPHQKFGLEFAGGSMGFGLPAGVGFALAKKMNKDDGKVYILMSDGEMQIGTTWESVLIAKQHNLSNLVIFVDNNRLQAMGKTEEILNIEPLDERVKSFGWAVQRVNGHDFEAIERTFNNFSNDSPNMVICDTIKGRGVSFMENENLYHYKNLSEEEYKEAMEELIQGGSTS
ncbi:MAG TPA: 1-deoxy-D-xylulose-5-phosphate synthase N-terminal domain-containing protein [Candidatus Paceibacterota bacterium]|nr:1-deoxy-D-xylulose-5-phosphate synthase N-terminal domain-containing protein [Candidatus Paceibacterota bacterium]